MEDVTYELSQLKRSLLAYNCPRGILKGGSSDGLKYARNGKSNDTLMAKGEVYYRTGEIEIDEYGNYHVVYKFKQ